MPAEDLAEFELRLVSNGMPKTRLLHSKMANRRAALVRHQLFLPKALGERLEALARAPGASKSEILAQALGAWVDRKCADEIELRFAQRIDRLSDQLVD